MWVSPPARGHGVGDRLVETIVKWAKNAGYGQLLLWVAEGNIHAEKLYERQGFKRTGDVIEDPRREFEMSRRI